jgi:hypothetical protein
MARGIALLGFRGVHQKAAPATNCHERGAPARTMSRRSLAPIVFIDDDEDGVHRLGGVSSLNVSTWIPLTIGDAVPRMAIETLNHVRGIEALGDNAITLWGLVRRRPQTSEACAWSFACTCHSDASRSGGAPLVWSILR